MDGWMNRWGMDEYERMNGWMNRWGMDEYERMDGWMDGQMGDG